MGEFGDDGSGVGSSSLLPLDDDLTAVATWRLQFRNTWQYLSQARTRVLLHVSALCRGVLGFKKL